MPAPFRSSETEPLAQLEEVRTRAASSREAPSRTASGKEGVVQESPDQLRQRNRMLEERISKLCAAVLRASASLDLQTVLREIVDSARELTGARYGMITTVDAAGQPQDWVTAGVDLRRARRNGRVDRRTEGVRALPGPSRAPAVGGPAGLRPGARHLDVGVSVEDAAARTGAAPRRARRQLLPRREGGRTGVHERRRGGPGPVRVAGGDGHRQRPHARERAAGAGRSGGPGRDLPGRRRRLRRQQRQARVVQPGGAAAGRPVAHARGRAGGPARRCHLPAGRRARGSLGGVSDGASS